MISCKHRAGLLFVSSYIQLVDIANRERVLLHSTGTCRESGARGQMPMWTGGVVGDEQVNLSSGSTQRLQIELFASTSGCSLAACSWHLLLAACANGGRCSCSSSRYAWCNCPHEDQRRLSGMLHLVNSRSLCGPFRVSLRY